MKEKDNKCKNINTSCIYLLYENKYFCCLRLHINNMNSNSCYTIFLFRKIIKRNIKSLPFYFFYI